MGEFKLDCALDLMRRLPPQTIEKNISNLIDLAPELCEDLLSSVDQPLKVSVDDNGKQYLLCDYNRDGDSYRSPWTNMYNPPLEIGPDGETGLLPSEKLRIFEVELNTAFDRYRELYFDGGISSCYVWDSNHINNGTFAGVILFKKIGDGSKSIKGCWDSIHVIEVKERQGGHSAHYKLTSSCMLWLQTNMKGSGMMNLGGSLTRQVELDATLQSLDRHPHIANIGRMVEDKESQIRNELHDIYFGKTKDIVNSLRSCQPLPDVEKSDNLMNSMFHELKDQSPQTQIDQNHK